LPGAHTTILVPVYIVCDKRYFYGVKATALRKADRAALRHRVFDFDRNIAINILTIGQN